MDLSERARTIEARLLNEAGEVTWNTADDLARRAAESIQDASLPGRNMVSSGTLQLAGDGVDGSSARIAAVGEVMLEFQRLVTAVGAAQSGFTALRGAYPAALLAKTHLRLVASPHVGSVVLDFMPELAPDAELYPDGVPLIDEPRTQAADDAVIEVIVVLEQARALPPNADEGPLLERLARRGPRVAVALREFTKTLSRADFQTDLTWREPGRPTRRVTLPADDAARLASLIASRELDHGEAVIEGIIHTISDKTALAIETADGWEHVKGSELPPEQLSAVPYGSRVRVVADAVEVAKPGGEVLVKYTAKRIEALDA